MSTHFPAFNAQATPNTMDSTTMAKVETSVSFTVWRKAGPSMDHTGFPVTYESPKSSCKHETSQFR
ncbi:hypothetical protein EMIT07CA2_130024 [Brevibacillus sp. IT-7CA2]